MYFGGHQKSLNLDEPASNAEKDTLRLEEMVMQTEGFKRARRALKQAITVAKNAKGGNSVMNSARTLGASLIKL